MPFGIHLERTFIFSFLSDRRVLLASHSIGYSHFLGGYVSHRVQPDQPLYGPLTKIKSPANANRPEEPEAEQRSNSTQELCLLKPLKPL